MTTVLPGQSIQAAVNNLPATGGIIQLVSGEYVIAKPIVPRGRVTFRGAGRDATIIRAKGCSGFVFAASKTDFANCFMAWEDLTIRGDYTPGTSGISLTFTHYWHVNRVIIERFALHGLDLHWSFVGTISVTTIRSNDSHGINAGEAVTCLTVGAGTEIRENNGWGVYCSGASDARVSLTNISGAVIEANCLGGIYYDFGGPLTIVGSFFEQNNVSIDWPKGRTPGVAPVVGRHILIGSVPESNCRGLVVAGCAFNNILGTGGTGYHIDLERVSGAEIHGNEFAVATKAVKNDLGGSENVIVSAANWFSSGMTIPEVIP